MPRRLVLIRHARAAPSQGADLLRPLTDEGREQARELGRRLRDVVSRPRVLSSPAARCLQTAHAVMTELGQDGAAETRSELIESAGAHDLLPLAEDAADGTILVGHQPGLVDLALALLRVSTAPFSLQPATALVLDQGEAGAWSLASVVRPPA